MGGEAHFDSNDLMYKHNFPYWVYETVRKNTSILSVLLFDVQLPLFVLSIYTFVSNTTQQ